MKTIFYYTFTCIFFSAINIADRNGSLETNESSSPETNKSDLEMKPTKTPPLNTLFDFNEFFKIDNIPGLTVIASECYSVPVAQ